MTKITVGILFGGQSAEHDISLISAKNVYDAIDKDKFDVQLIGIDKNGKWYLNEASQFLLEKEGPLKLYASQNNKVTLPLGERALRLQESSRVQKIDVVFPVLHGPMGEDGTVQGLLKLSGIPFVGCDVLSSAISMDKDVTKRLFKEAGFLVLKSRTAFDFEASTLDYDEIVRDLGELLFVKPCNLGSSVGISKVRTKNEFKKAIDVAFQFDQKILIESAASTNKPREIELAVLGDHESIDVSVAGEIVPNQDFYTYSAKYLDENGADLIVPAKLSEPLLKNLQDLAKHAFRTLCCYGMARVDFFLTEDNTIYLNEINSIPGFTKISMYPKLWEASGIPYSKLIERLIELSMSRFEKQRRLKIS